MPDFTAFDGTERDPRPIQVDTLRRLHENWTKTEIQCAILPTGTGKSAIARAIQIATGADVITISNALVTQYSGDYPHVNFLKGKAHYPCKSWAGLSCKDAAACELPVCEGCPYQFARDSATEGFATFFNPMSYYYFLLNSHTTGNRTLVIDEAHQLPGMVLLLCGKRFKRSDYKFTEKCCNELFFVEWVRQQLDRLTRLSEMYYRQKDMEKLAKCKDEIENLALVKEGMEEDPQNYVIWITEDKKEMYLNVKPIFPPRFLMDRIVAKKRLILMSGTLFDHDIKMIAGERNYVKIEQNSPIPKKNRQIFWKPAPFPVNWQTDPAQLVNYIESFLPNDGTNVLIHSTYSLSKKLFSHFKRPIIYNTQEDKEEKIAEFKRKGGIFLASGCAEGIDFKGDLCRLNIIPKLSFPDLNDPGVKKRKAMQDGDEWYSLETLRVAIQQAGRSTRSTDDWSTTLVLDPNFKRLVIRNQTKLPRYFLEAINWG